MAEPLIARGSMDFHHPRKPMKRHLTVFLMMALLSGCQKKPLKPIDSGDAENRAIAPKMDTYVEIEHSQEGGILIRRSDVLSEVVAISLMRENNCIWRIKYGARNFSQIEYGILPKFDDHMMDPYQITPAGGKPDAPEEGDLLRLILEFRKDYFPMSPSTAAETWAITIPGKGTKCIARKID